MWISVLLLVCFLVAVHSFDHRVGKKKRTTTGDASVKPKTTLEKKPVTADSNSNNNKNSRAAPRQRVANRFPDLIEPIELEHSLDGVHFHALGRVVSKPRSLKATLESADDSSSARLLNDFSVTPKYCVMASGGGGGGVFFFVSMFRFL
jgi:hypothetical protein